MCLAEKGIDKGLGATGEGQKFGVDRCSLH
jgi:hypothetical protein